MAQGLLNIKFSMPDWSKSVAGKNRELNLFVAAQMQYNRGMLFNNEGAYNGHDRWADLKFRHGKILSDRGTLRKSIAPSGVTDRPRTAQGSIVRISGNDITIGTSLIYARMMNDGTTKMPDGKLRPVRAKALKIPLPSGKSATGIAKGLRKESGKARGFIFRASVKIPARDFETINRQDIMQWEEALKNKIEAMMKRTTERT